MENLLISAKIASPIIRASGYMTLDAILGSAIAGDYCPEKEVITRIPIANEKGLFLASAMIAAPIQMAHYAIAGSMRADKQINLSNIQLNKHGEIHTDPFATQFKAVMNSYIAITSPTVEWIATGDKSAIEALLKDINFIGKRRSAGYGEVMQWSITKTDRSPLVDDDGNAMRPIPVNMFKGNRNAPVMDAAWMPAYWNPMNRAACYAPTLVTS